MAPQDRSQQTAIAMVTMCWMSMVLRFYINGYMVRKINRDDWGMLATTMIFTAYCGILYKMVSLLVATFSTGINVALLPMTTKYMFLVSNLFMGCTIILKISFTLFLLRFVIVRWQRVVLYSSTTIYLFCGTAYFASILFSCGNPFHYYENRLAGRCFNRDKIVIPTAYAYCTVNALTDCTFSIIAIFWARGMSFKKIEGRVVKVILVLGVLSMGCSFIPLYFIHMLKLDLTTIISKIYVLATLSMLKVGGSVVATSLEALEPLFFKPETAETKDDLNRISTSTSSTVSAGWEKRSTGSTWGKHSTVSTWEKDFEKGPKVIVTRTATVDRAPRITVSEAPEMVEPPRPRRYSHHRRTQYSQHRLTQTKLADRCEYRRSVYNANRQSMVGGHNHQRRHTRWSTFFGEEDALPPVPPPKPYMPGHKQKRGTYQQRPVFYDAPPMPAPGHTRWI